MFLAFLGKVFHKVFHMWKTFYVENSIVENFLCGKVENSEKPFIFKYLRLKVFHMFSTMGTILGGPKCGKLSFPHFDAYALWKTFLLPLGAIRLFRTFPQLVHCVC